MTKRREESTFDMESVGLQVRIDRFLFLLRRRERGEDVVFVMDKMPECVRFFAVQTSGMLRSRRKSFG